MDLEQLTCEKCGEAYHEQPLKPDEFCFKNVCQTCRPKTNIDVIRTIKTVARKSTADKSQ